MSRDRRKRTVRDHSWRRAIALGTAFALAVLAVPSARAATVVWGGGNGTFMVGTTNELFYIDKVSDGDAYL